MPIKDKESQSQRKTAIRMIMFKGNVGIRLELVSEIMK